MPQQAAAASGIRVCRQARLPENMRSPAPLDKGGPSGFLPPALPCLAPPRKRPAHPPSSAPGRWGRGPHPPAGRAQTGCATPCLCPGRPLWPGSRRRPRSPPHRRCRPRRCRSPRSSPPSPAAGPPRRAPLPLPLPPRSADPGLDGAAAAAGCAAGSRGVARPGKEGAGKQRGRTGASLATGNCAGNAAVQARE